jgi:hypothetical protein
MVGFSRPGLKSIDRPGELLYGKNKLYATRGGFKSRMRLFKRYRKRLPRSESTVGHSPIWAPLSFNFRQYSLVAAGLLVMAGGVLLFAANSSDLSTPQFAGSITDFTDPKYLLSLPFGFRSFYDQPSRAYMNTLPATTLLNAVGINYDSGSQTNPEIPQQVDHLLSDTGFKHVRIVVAWGGMSYNNPTQLSTTQNAKLQEDIGAMKANNLRPLITLEAYDSSPDPSTTIRGTFTVKPQIGDKTIQVSAATAAQIIPGRTGLNRNGIMAGTLFTTVKGDTVTLSRPIDKSTDLSGKMSVLSFAPFQKPFLADGTTPNPAFTTTMNGWLNYVKAVSDTTKSTLGSDQFDLEIWNEIVSNFHFLNADDYYAVPPDAGDQGDVKQQILKQTGAFIQNPANGLTDVQITDGFASQSPFPSGVGLAPGVLALSKHYYPQAQRVYPQDVVQNNIRPLNALLQKGWSSAHAPYIDSFIPNVVVHYPESWLSALNTETEVRDMSPITNDVYGEPHGVNAVTPTGQHSQVWETEWNFGLTEDPEGLQALGGTGKKGKGSWSPTDEDYIQSKADIRYLSSYINKGLSQVDFFAATGKGDLGMIRGGFLGAIAQNPTTYPGDAAGGEIMQVLQRYLKAFSGATTITQPRSLSLNELDDYAGNIQFKGNGTVAYPDLYDRDLFGFFPYQVTNTKFVIPVYIQTLDAEKIYNSKATDPTQFDMPPETYRLTIGGIHGKDVSAVSLYDPLTQQTPGVNVISKGADDIVVEVPVTDSPRLLSITECSSCHNPPPSPQAPTINISQPAAGATVSGTVDLEATTTVDPSRTVASVQYFRDGKAQSGLIQAAPYDYKWLTKQGNNATYTWTAVVQDSSGGTATSSPVTLTVHNGGTDAPPTIPTGLTSTAKTQSSITLSWNPSTDVGGSGVVGYRVYRNNSLVASPTTPSYTDTGLTASTQYTYSVSALNQGGLTSNKSSKYTVTTLAGKTAYNLLHNLFSRSLAIILPDYTQLRPAVRL